MISPLWRENYGKKNEKSRAVRAQANGNMEEEMA